MTIAELHGKLAPDRPQGVHERMEDLLTSDVFGTMKYAGLENGFLDWLLQAQPAPTSPAPLPIQTHLNPQRITRADYSFWPRLDNNLEPDVAILLWLDEGDALLILVEAKYLSGVGDSEGDEPGNLRGLTGNQIADQVRGLNQMSLQGLLGWFDPPHRSQSVSADRTIRRIQLFITAHTSLPGQDYELATRRLGSRWPLPAYWLSWTSLAECLRPHMQQSDRRLAELIGDLWKLLQRKGLVPFRGFDMEPWHDPSGTGSFWQEKWWSMSPLVLEPYESFWRTSR